MNKIYKITLTIIMSLIFLLPGCSFISLDLMDLMQIQPFEERVFQKGSKDKVLVIEILGMITTTSTRDGFFRKQGTLERLDSVLKKAVKDNHIKGLIIRIDSPGGGMTASDLVYRRLVSFKNEHNLPAVACITNQGTSGAYMAALSADKIVALPSSIVGNVGVILPSVSLEGLMDKLGIDNQTITSGKFKDTGNPLRDMTDADMDILKAIVMEFYDMFINRVKEVRPVTDEDIAVIGDGRVMSASVGTKHHLIDQVGYYEDSIKAIEALANIEKPTVIVYRRQGENSGSFYSWP